MASRRGNSPGGVACTGNFVPFALNTQVVQRKPVRYLVRRAGQPEVLRYNKGGDVRITWRLRMVAAEHGVWSGAELRRILKQRAGKDLSAPSISVLMTKQPRELKLDTLAALCVALDCTPNDLIVIANDEAPNTNPTKSARAGVTADETLIGRPQGDRTLV